MTQEFLVLSLIVVLLPGTGVIYTLGCALGRGMGAGVLAALGCTLGIVPHMAASVIGLSALVHASAEVFIVIKYLGVAYLLYMAYRSLRQSGPLAVTRRQNRTSAVRTVVDGILLNILNPKLTGFFFAFLPQFVPPTATDPLGFMAGLALVFMLLTFVVFLGYGALASLAHTHVVSNPRVLTWLNRLFAGVFGLFAARLALSER